jgi:hypothetical protein
LTRKVYARPMSSEHLPALRSYAPNVLRGARVWTWGGLAHVEMTLTLEMDDPTAPFLRQLLRRRRSSIAAVGCAKAWPPAIAADLCN